MPNRWLAPVMFGLALAMTVPSVASAQRLGGVSAAVHGGGGGGFGGGGRGGSYGGGGYRGGGYYGGGGFRGIYMNGGPPGYVSPWVSLYYPYYWGYTGTRVRQDAMSSDRHLFAGPSVVGIVDASAGYVFDGIVHGQVSGVVDVTGVLRFEARYGAYFEQTRDQIQAIGIGRLSIAFPFVNEDVVQFRGGVGLQIYHDVIAPEIGYSGLLELDVFPVEPLVLRAEASAGALGQAFFVDARATVGFQIDRGELYFGYQLFDVAGAGGSTMLQGPIAGLRVWIS